ncbi:TPA: hypothetical protein ACGO0Q_002338, partial [Streptococcus suis]
LFFRFHYHPLMPLLLLAEFEKMHFQTVPYPQKVYLHTFGQKVVEIVHRKHATRSKSHRVHVFFLCSRANHAEWLVYRLILDVFV